MAFVFAAAVVYTSFWRDDRYDTRASESPLRKGSIELTKVPGSSPIAGAPNDSSSSDDDATCMEDMQDTIADIASARHTKQSPKESALTQPLVRTVVARMHVEIYV